MRKAVIIIALLLVTSVAVIAATQAQFYRSPFPYPYYRSQGVERVTHFDPRVQESHIDSIVYLKAAEELTYPGYGRGGTPPFAARGTAKVKQRLVKTGGRLIKHARYYWLLLAESHLTRRLFASMLGRMTVETPTVTIDGLDAVVQFSGLAPTFVGLYQVNAVVPPEGVGMANDIPIVLTIGGRQSNPNKTVTIAVAETGGTSSGGGGGTAPPVDGGTEDDLLDDDDDDPLDDGY